MELVANVWPVVDGTAGLIQRYFVRAYAMEAPDAVISDTLQALAATDFRIAHVFQIPPRFEHVTPYGTLNGCVSPTLFYEYQSAILEPAFRELEKGFARLQGISIAGSDGKPVAVGIIPRFPAEPYLLVTTLVETPDGRLLPQIKS